MSDSTAGRRSSDVDAALPGSATVNGSGQIEQLLADQRQSWLRGQCARVEDYLRWAPDLAENARAVLELIVNEFRLRAELGLHPTRLDFERRFPQIADQLRAEFQSAGLSTSETNVTEPSAVDRPNETATSLAAEPFGSTEYEQIPSAGSPFVDPTEHSESHANDAPTSLIEASEAIARELAGRELTGRPAKPAASTIVQMLQDALKHSSHSRPRPERPVPEVTGYDIQDELGRGAVGVVYKARQNGLNRVVALKMILAGGHASLTTLSRFRAEAEAVASLQHGNIVQVYEIGECDGLPFFSLEYCAGGSLAERLHGTPLAADVAAQTILKLARAMHYAHGCKVVHRDLKPGNILLHPKDDSGRPAESPAANEPFDFDSVILKISDFGLAKRLDEDSQTKTGAVLGTPSYMAPEQASGKIREVGPLADIYALGAILYELLTGRPPFRAATALDTVVQVIHDEPVPPRRLQSGVPADLETIALKCLEKDPQKRYPSAAALADDVQRFLDREPIMARPIGFLERTWRWCRRNPMVSSLTALAAFLLIAGTLVSLYFAHQSRERAVLAIQNEGKARREREAARRNQYVAEMNLVQRAWRDVEMARVRALLRAQSPLSGDDTDFRGPEWHYWNRLASADLATYSTDVGHEPCLALCPDGRFVAVGGKDKVIAVWDMATGQVIARLTGHTDAIVGLAYLPDGRLLSASTARESDGGRTFVRGAEILSWSVGNQKRLDRKVIPADAELTRFAADAAGRVGALACADGTVLLVNISDGRVLHSLTGSGDAAISVAVTADGARLAAGFANGDVIVWNAGTGQRLKVLNRSHWVAHSVAFSPEGRRLAVGGGSAAVNDAGIRLEGDVRVWDIESWRELAQLRGHASSVLTLAFSAHGNRIVTASNDRTVRVWDALNGQLLALLQGHERAVSGALVSPDGRTIYSAGDDATLRVWESTQPTAGLALSADLRSRTTAWALSPDEKQVAVAFAAGESGSAEIGLFDVLSQQRARTARLGGKAVLAMAWRPDRLELTAISSGDSTQLVRIDTKSGKVSQSKPVALESVVDAVYSSDGQRLAIAGQYRIVVHHADTGAELQRFDSPRGRVASMGFSKSGAIRAVSVDGSRAFVWDSGDPSAARALTGHHEAILSVAISRDLKMIATGSADQTVHIWDAETGSDLIGHPLPGHVSSVTALAFSPDGLRLASAGQDFDRTVRVWDVATGQELLVLSSSTGQEPRLAFSANGGWLFAQRDEIAAWDLRPLSVASAAERAALAAVRYHFDRPVGRAEALTAIQTDPSLTADMRDLATKLAVDWPDVTDRYLNAAWQIVRSPYYSPAEYEQALSWAERFRTTNPNRGESRILVGIAQFRLARWADARQSLEAKERDGAGTLRLAARRAVLAMLWVQAGELARARAELNALDADPAALMIGELLREARGRLGDSPR